MYEEDSDEWIIKSMGDVSTRRDNPDIVKKIYKNIRYKLLIDKDRKGAIEFLLKNIDDLMANKLEVKDFTFSKSLRLHYKDEKTIPHKMLANRIGIRDPGNKPQPNDRLQFVYIKQLDKDKQAPGDNIETPEFVLENDMEVDTLRYLESQIMNPICALISPVIEEPQEIFKEIIKREKNKRKTEERKFNMTKMGFNSLDNFIVNNSQINTNKYYDKFINKISIIDVNKKNKSNKKTKKSINITDFISNQINIEKQKLEI